MERVHHQAARAVWYATWRRAESLCQVHLLLVQRRSDDEHEHTSLRVTSPSLCCVFGELEILISPWHRLWESLCTGVHPPHWVRISLELASLIEDAFGGAPIEHKSSGLSVPNLLCCSCARHLPGQHLLSIRCKVEMNGGYADEILAASFTMKVPWDPICPWRKPTLPQSNMLRNPYERWKTPLRHMEMIMTRKEQSFPVIQSGWKQIHGILGNGGSKTPPT